MWCAREDARTRLGQARRAQMDKNSSLCKGAFAFALPSRPHPKQPPVKLPQFPPPRKFQTNRGWTPPKTPRRAHAPDAGAASLRDALAYSRASSWFADYGTGNRNTSISGWLAGRNGRHPPSKAPIDGGRGGREGLALCRAVPVADSRPEPVGPDLRPSVLHQASHSAPHWLRSAGPARAHHRLHAAGLGLALPPNLARACRARLGALASPEHTPPLPEQRCTVRAAGATSPATMSYSPLWLSSRPCRMLKVPWVHGPYSQYLCYQQPTRPATAIEAHALVQGRPLGPGRE
eukprot:scaffold87681_cov69-Phaeocystis_antarctica.AAC.3